MCKTCKFWEPFQNLLCLGEKIAELLQAAGGDWSEVELTVKKIFEKEEMSKISGGWVTEIDLLEKKWTTEMIEHSKQFAQANGHIRTSKVHGQEEWRLPLRDEFANTEVNRESYESQTSTTIQAPAGSH